MTERTPARRKAKLLAKSLRKENPDYNYLRNLFTYLRKELNILITPKPKKLPYVPTEEEIQKYHKAVWESRNMHHVVLIKTLLYTGVRVSELINIKIEDVDFDRCQIKIQQKRGRKDRMVLFPVNFKEVLAMHTSYTRNKGGKYLFESTHRSKYTDRGIRKILEQYTRIAGIEHSISPNRLRHFLFTWLKKQGIDDALIQPFSGHEHQQSLEMYSKLSVEDVQKLGQKEYNTVIKTFPV